MKFDNLIICPSCGAYLDPTEEKTITCPYCDCSFSPEDDAPVNNEEEIEQDDMYVKSQENNKKFDSKTKKNLLRVIITLAVIYVALIIISVVSRCQNGGNFDSYDNKKIDNTFKKIMNTQLRVNFGITEENYIEKIHVVTYEDRYPDNFSISILASKGDNVYLYSATDVDYPEDKSGYKNFVTFLTKKSDNDTPLLGFNHTYTYDKSLNQTIHTDMEYEKHIIVEDGYERYFAGFYRSGYTFRVYPLQSFNDENSDPYVVSEFGYRPYVEIYSRDPLYGFYEYLLKK